MNNSEMEMRGACRRLTSVEKLIIRCICPSSGNEKLFIEDFIEEPLDARGVETFFVTLDEALTKKERQVISYRYGLGGWYEVSQETTSEELGIPLERVRRLESQAMQKLRKGENFYILWSLVMTKQSLRREYVSNKKKLNSFREQLNSCREQLDSCREQLAFYEKNLEKSALSED